MNAVMICMLPDSICMRSCFPSGHAGVQPGLRDGHLFSLFLMLPLAYVTLALLLFNWYPSQVSVTLPLIVHGQAVHRVGGPSIVLALAIHTVKLLLTLRICMCFHSQ